MSPVQFTFYSAAGQERGLKNDYDFISSRAKKSIV
jgi:hypothetical protein